MQCSYCQGKFEPLLVSDSRGNKVRLHKCGQCAGFWVDAHSETRLDSESLIGTDIPQAHYSLHSPTIVCPNDSEILEKIDHDAAPGNIKAWSCPKCNGSFYPRGQLALLIANRESDLETALHSGGVHTRIQGTLATFLVIVGGLLSVAAFQRISGSDFSFQAATNEPLPTSGPNFLMLVLIALSYLAGTVLAVLARKLPLILMGWGVIAICLVGFFVVILGP